MTDPTVLAGAVVTVIGALTIAAVTIINAVAKAKAETLVHIDDVREKVNGNYSDLKQELVAANQRIAVLTERLLNTTASKPEGQ
jgi:hypothetical protein